MCCEDVKIDFEKKAIGRLVTLNNSSTEIAAADPWRIGLVICQPTSGVGWAIADQAAATDKGFPLSFSLPPVILTRECQGDIIGKPWFAIHNTGGVSIYVIETFLLPGGICDHGQQPKSSVVYSAASQGQLVRSAGVGRPLAGVR